MKNVLVLEFICIAMFFSANSYCQESIDPSCKIDRPNQVITANPVGNGNLAYFGSYAFNWPEDRWRKKYDFNTTHLIRYGILSYLEASIKFDTKLRTWEESEFFTRGNRFGISDAEIGLKFAKGIQKNGSATMACILGVDLNHKGGEFDQEGNFFFFSLLISYNILPNLFVDLNGGFNHEDSNLYISGRLNKLFTKTYGIYVDYRYSSYHDIQFGAMYRIANSLRIELKGGWIEDCCSPDWVCGLGVSVGI